MKKFKTVKKKHGNDVERVFVDQLLDEIDDFGLPITVISDTDSKARVFDSGYDFQLCWAGMSIFVEAKRTLQSDTAIDRPYKGDIWNLLRDEQKVLCAQLNISGTPYYVVHFRTLKNAVKVVVDVYQIISERQALAQDIRIVKLVKEATSMNATAEFFTEKFSKAFT